jgi:acyl-CoA thioesterase FadM
MTDTSAFFHCSLTPRFTDLDTWRHVNNSRIYQLHQEARLLAHLELFGADAWFSDDVRLRPLRCITDFRRVTWYGSDVKAEIRVQACDNDSYRVRSDLFQNGEHVGTQQALMGAYQNGQRVELPTATREHLQSVAEGDTEALPATDYVDRVSSVINFPVTQQLTTRYADLDADSQRSEAALARYMEQARFGAIRHLDLGGLGILIASMDVSYLHFRAGWKPVDLRAGINRIGNSSFVFTGCATSEHGLQAVANSVMVVIDQASSRPAPIPDILREQLNTLTI